MFNKIAKDKYFYLYGITHSVFVLVNMKTIYVGPTYNNLLKVFKVFQTIPFLIMTMKDGIAHTCVYPDAHKMMLLAQAHSTIPLASKNIFTQKINAP